jgi:hypothetical protein
MNAMWPIVFLSMIAVAMAVTCGESDLPEGVTGTCADSCGEGKAEIFAQCNQEQKCCVPVDPTYCSAVVPKISVVFEDTPVFGLCKSACGELTEEVTGSACPSSKKCCVEKKFVALVKTEAFQLLLLEELGKPAPQMQAMTLTHEDSSGEESLIQKSTAKSSKLPSLKRVRQQLAPKQEESFLETSTKTKANCRKRRNLAPLQKHIPTGCESEGTVSTVYNTRYQGCCVFTADLTTKAICGNHHRFRNALADGTPSPNGPCCLSDCLEMGGRLENGVCRQHCEINNPPQVQCLGFYCTDEPTDCNLIKTALLLTVGGSIITVFSILLSGGFAALIAAAAALVTPGGAILTVGVAAATLKTLVVGTCPDPRGPGVIPFRPDQPAE